METITNFISQVGSWVGPIVTVLLGIYFTVKGIVDKFNRKRNKAKENTIVDLLSQVANDNGNTKKNTKKIEELESKVDAMENLLKTESDTIRTQSSILAEMFSLVFENSTLPPEVKERLRVLKTKIDCPSSAEALEKITKANSKLKEELAYVKHSLSDLQEQNEVRIVNEPVADTVKKTTQTIIQ